MCGSIGYGVWGAASTMPFTFSANLSNTPASYTVMVETKDSANTISSPLSCGTVSVDGTTTPTGGTGIDLKAHKSLVDVGTESTTTVNSGKPIYMSWTGLTAMNIDPSSECNMNLAPTDGATMPVISLSATFSAITQDFPTPQKMIPDTGNYSLPAGSYSAAIVCSPTYHAGIFDLFAKALANTVSAQSNIVPIKVLRSTIKEF